MTSRLVPPPLHPLNPHGTSQSSSTGTNVESTTNTRRRGGPSFYLPSNSVVASPASSHHSRHNSQSTTSNNNLSLHSSPAHSRRGSNANLAMTLAVYRIPPPKPHITDAQGVTQTATPAVQSEPSSFPELKFSPDVHPLKLLPSAYKSHSSLVLGNIGNDQFGQQRMDAVVEIHRVLYRGKEDLLLRGTTRQWRQQGRAVKRVLERFFEDECSYDHPLVQINSRQKLMAHFALLHLLSTGYMPAITMRSLYHHVQDLPVLDLLGGVISSARQYLHGPLGREKDVEAAQQDEGSDSIKGKPLPLVDEKEPILSPVGVPSEHSDEEEVSEVERKREETKWWKLWDVNAECKEIGGMETYEGHHLAMVEHVITLTIFPAFARSQTPLRPALSTSSSTDSFAGHVPGPVENLVVAARQRSFIRKLITIIVSELDEFLNFDLPIQTIVHFNEVGKATQVRDYLDFRDCIETFVPFAKKFGWITRRFSGYFSSTIGSLALSLVPSASVKGPAKPLMLEKGKESINSHILKASDNLHQGIRTTRVGSGPKVTTADMADRLAGPSHRTTSRDRVFAASAQVSPMGNSLGLQGVGEPRSSGVPSASPFGVEP